MVRNYLPVGRGMYATNVVLEFVHSVFQDIVVATHEVDSSVADVLLAL